MHFGGTEVHPQQGRKILPPPRGATWAGIHARRKAGKIKKVATHMNAFDLPLKNVPGLCQVGTPCIHTPSGIKCFFVRNAADEEGYIEILYVPATGGYSSVIAVRCEELSINIKDPIGFAHAVWWLAKPYWKDSLPQKGVSLHYNYELDYWFLKGPGARVELPNISDRPDFPKDPSEEAWGEYLAGTLRAYVLNEANSR